MPRPPIEVSPLPLLAVGAPCVVVASEGPGLLDGDEARSIGEAWGHDALERALRRARGAAEGFAEAQTCVHVEGGPGAPVAHLLHLGAGERVGATARDVERVLTWTEAALARATALAVELGAPLRVALPLLGAGPRALPPRKSAGAIIAASLMYFGSDEERRIEGLVLAVPRAEDHAIAAEVVRATRS